DAGPGVRHHRRAALVPRRDIARAALDHRVRHVKVPAAHDAEHGVRAEPGQRPSDRVAYPQRRSGGDDPPVPPRRLRGHYRSTRAIARHGDPDPRRIGSGPVITSAPWAGSRSRLRSWVSPYLPAPSMAEWQGNGGSNECAAPASVPTVSTPIPITGDSSASQAAQGTLMPGVCGPVSFA